MCKDTVCKDAVYYVRLVGDIVCVKMLCKDTLCKNAVYCVRLVGDIVCVKILCTV